MKPAMPRWPLPFRSAITCLSCLLAACAAVVPEKLPVPDGSARVPVNRHMAKNEAHELRRGRATAQPATFTLEAHTRTAEGQGREVSLLATLSKIARNTGLRLRDNGLPDERLSIIPDADPFDVLRQLAAKSRYRISLDRATGYLALHRREGGDTDGVLVLRDALPIEQVGAPVEFLKMPAEPLLMVDALRLLAPPHFDVGHEENIDPNIRVHLDQATNWLDALERVALQTPYRVVFDWNQKLVYAVPVTTPAVRQPTQEQPK